METTALSKLYIDKLGHNLEEIRLRALNHIIFKLNRKLISSKDIALNSEFINQLLRWFDHEPIVEEEKVINLLLKLIESNNDARRYWQYVGVPRRLRSARKKISSKYRQDLDKVLDLIALSENSKIKKIENTAHQERSVESECSSFAAFFLGEPEIDQLQQCSLAENPSRENEVEKYLSYQPKSMWYPSQPLSPGDLHVLSSVEHSLSTGLEKHMQCNDSYDGEKNYIDQEDTLIRCCQFVFDVILHDFFPEVFLQQPGIVSTLLDLLSTLGLQLHPGFIDESKDGKTVETLNWIIRCLHCLATSLHAQLLFYADPGIPNLKDNTVMSSSSGTSNASNSLVISPIGNLKFRNQDALLRHSDHFSLPLDNLLTPVNCSPGVSGFCQFSLPHFCISVLFQTLSLITVHLSGSHSRIFQSLMSLSSASVQLLSKIVDPDMWVSVNPVSSAVTAGISEIFRILGEGLLRYQRYLSQKKDNSFPHSSVSQSDASSQNLKSTFSKYSFSNSKEPCRLAYVQVLFLTHSFLALAPKEPSLCRSSVPEEFAHALMIAIFDPSLHLLFPKLHHDLLKVVKCLSQEAERVCEQALKIAESVKMGIKILKGTKKSYKDVRVALPGLAFHESKDIIRKCWDCCMEINYQECSEAIKLAKHVGNDNRLEKVYRTRHSSSPSLSRGACSSQAGLRKSIGSCKSTSPLSEAYAKLCINGMKNYVNGHDCQPGSKEGIMSESESRIPVILKLLAHESNMVQREVYSYCWEIVAKLLGTASEKDFHSRVSRKPTLQTQKVELEQLSFVWNRSVFTEIIIHGATSTDTKIKKCATEIILFVLKSKTIVGEKNWTEIMETFITCLPLLLCFADSETHLGKAITRMFDPDISLSIGLSTFHAIRGNCNLLFNSDPAVRGEAATRLAWLLSHESIEEANSVGSIVIDSWKNMNSRLPDRDTLALSGHSSLSNVFVFQAEDNAFNIPPKCFPSSYVYQAENVIQLLSLIEKKLDGDISLSDARLCCSALNQLALTLGKNCQLHSAFLLNSGIDIVLRIFQGALVEDDIEHYPDCSVPIVNILKNIAHWNSKVRKDLSQIEVVYHCILRAIILFYDEKAFRIDAAHLLCLLLFSDYILVLIPTPSSNASANSLSLPYILSQNVHIPFPCSSHWQTSHHSTTSPLSPSLMPERGNPLPEGIHSWKGSNKFKESLPWQGLIRLHGSWEWYGGELLLNVEKRKKTPAVIENEDLEELHQPFPSLLQMSSSEINDFKATDIISSCRSQLFDIQNSTTHLSVERALNMLKGYVSIWNATLAEGGELLETKWDASPPPWNGTLGRFLLRSPANHQDSELLIQMCSFLRTAEEGKAKNQILEKRDKNGQKHNWLEELLQNPTTLQPLLCPFNPSSSDLPGTVCFTQEAFDGCPSQRAVCREVLSLIQEIAGNSELGSDGQKIGWAHAIYFIAQSLQFGDAEHFYDLAFLEWALSCLVQLTGKTGWGPGLNEITAIVNKNRSENDHVLIWEGLISGLIEILTAFHHGGQLLPNWTPEDGRPDLNKKDNIGRSANSEDGILSNESLEVSGSFMGLSITRSALLCLNHVLSEMQNTCIQASKENWESVWSRVLMNAGRNEKRGHLRSLWQESLQGWLLSHWFSRDTIVRAAALKLASGFVAISCPANVSATVKKAKKGQNAQENIDPTFGLKLLEEGLSQKPGGMWGTVLSLFLDNFESNIVREQAAILLSNFISASEQIPEQAADMMQGESPFFKEIGVLASQLFLSSSLQQPLSSVASKCIDEGGIKSIMWCTPSLLQAVCKLLRNITVLKPGAISSAMWENNGYLFRRLYGCLGKIPKGRKQNHVETMLYVDVVGLYSEILSLLSSIMLWDSRLEILLPQPHPLTAVFLILESKKYRECEEFESLKNRLWRKAFGFISVAIGSLVYRKSNSLTIKDADIVLERCYSVFLDAVYESITGNDMELKKSALYSLNALFSLEIQCSVCEAEAVEFNKSDGKGAFSLVDLFDSTCDKHLEEKTEFISKNSQKMSLFEEESGSKSAMRITHLLINLYQPERPAVPEVCIPLSSLLAMSTKAKWCALSSGLMENIVLRCKNLYVAIIMGESEDSLLSQTNFMRGSAGKKQSPKQWMCTMSLLFRLLTNFLHSGTKGTLGIESSTPGADFVKIEAVRLGLSDVLHKLCPFAMLSASLLLDLLRLLTTFTTDCFSACQSLIHTSKAVGTGPCQNLLSSSLIHLLCDLAMKEMDSLLFIQLASQSKKSMEENMKESMEVLGAVFASLRNACDVQECRAVLVKGSLLPSFLNLHRNEKKITNQSSEIIEDLWLPFLLQLTTYSEGQLSLPKIPDMFDLLLSLSKMATYKRYSFLSVLRNLALHSQNRTRFLSSEEFLKLLVQILSKPDKRMWQKEEAAIIVHALCSNNYKAKQILKGVGVENALKEAISILWAGDGSEDFSQESISSAGRGGIRTEIERVVNVLRSTISILGNYIDERHSL